MYTIIHMYLLTGRGCVHKHLHCTHSNSSLAGDVYTNTDTVHTVTPHWMGYVYTNIYCTHSTSSQDGGCVHKHLLNTQYLLTGRGGCTQTSRDTVRTVPPHRMGDVYTNINCTHSTSTQDGGCVHKHLLYTQYLLADRGCVHKHLLALYTPVVQFTESCGCVTTVADRKISVSQLEKISGLTHDFFN